MQIIEGAGQWVAPAAGAATDWAEHFAVPALSVGTYCIPAGGTDDQSPHTEDEIYVVTAGRARIATPQGAAKLGPGSVIFVPASPTGCGWYRSTSRRAGHGGGSCPRPALIPASPRSSLPPA